MLHIKWKLFEKGIQLWSFQSVLEFAGGEKSDLKYGHWVSMESSGKSGVSAVGILHFWASQPEIFELQGCAQKVKILNFFLLGSFLYGPNIILTKSGHNQNNFFFTLLLKISVWGGQLIEISLIYLWLPNILAAYTTNGGISCIKQTHQTVGQNETESVIVKGYSYYCVISTAMPFCTHHQFLSVFIHNWQ